MDYEHDDRRAADVPGAPGAEESDLPAGSESQTDDLFDGMFLSGGMNPPAFAAVDHDLGFPPPEAPDLASAFLAALDAIDDRRFVTPVPEEPPAAPVVEEPAYELRPQSQLELESAEPAESADRSDRGDETSAEPLPWDTQARVEELALVESSESSAPIEESEYFTAGQVDEEEEVEEREEDEDEELTMLSTAELTAAFDGDADSDADVDDAGGAADAVAAAAAVAAVEAAAAAAVADADSDGEAYAFAEAEALAALAPAGTEAQEDEAAELEIEPAAPAIGLIASPQSEPDPDPELELEPALGAAAAIDDEDFELELEPSIGSEPMDAAPMTFDGPDAFAPAAVAVAEPEPEPESDELEDLQDFVVFSLGDLRCVVPIRNVVEVGRIPDAAAVPNAPAWLYGLGNLRGQVLSLIDLRAFFGVGRIKPSAGRMVVLRGDADDITAGVMVDQVHQIVALSPSRFKAAPAGLALPERSTGFVWGACDYGNFTMIGLDVDGVLGVESLTEETV